MNRKTIGALLIAGLIAMAVFVGTAAANGGADLYGSRVFGDFEQRHNFTTTNNLYAWGDFGDYSYTYGNPPCPEGCGGRVYVVEHQETWTNGTPLIDVSGGYETVPWGNFLFVMAWPKPLTPGIYDLILDLNLGGYYYVWTNITNPYYGSSGITDPIWTIYVTGPPEPEISINKTASTTGTCPGSDPLTVHIGDTVTYCFNVTNTGDVTLTNVAVNDDLYGTIALGTDTLAPGESTGGTTTHTVIEADIPSVTNKATVNATDPASKPVNNTDSCTIIVEYSATVESSVSIAVYIDIKPESCPNPINPGKKGLQSVAVLGTDDFDVTDIDPSTIWLTREGVGGKVAPLRWSYEDVATPFEGELCDCHEEGADGYIDLTLKFKTQELVSTLELEKVVGEIIPLNLTGNLEDGRSFEGQDCIWVLETDKK